MNRTVKPEKFCQNFLSPALPIYQCHLPSSHSFLLQPSIQLRTECRPLIVLQPVGTVERGWGRRCGSFTEEVYERLWLQTWAGKVLSLNFSDLIKSTNCKLISLWVANWLLGLTNFWGECEANLLQAQQTRQTKQRLRNANSAYATCSAANWRSWESCQRWVSTGCRVS